MTKTQKTQPTPIDELIVGKTYIITTFVVDEPRRKMQATIRKNTHDYITAETKVIVDRRSHYGLATWQKLSSRCWTFTEVGA
jgi:hypothetical protein